MAEKPEDLSLPASVVARIIKDALPDGVSVSKEARVAIGKAASVFILYCTACSNNLALQAKRKTLAATDVLSALTDMEFEEFVPDLKAFLEAYKKDQKGKKVAAADRRKQKAVAAAQAAPVSSDTQSPTLSSPSLPQATEAGGVAPGNNGGMESGGVSEEQEELMETDTVAQAPLVGTTSETVITNIS